MGFVRDRSLWKLGSYSVEKGVLYKQSNGDVKICSQVMIRGVVPV
jgi:hypothetical protein